MVNDIIGLVLVTPIFGIAAWIFLRLFWGIVVDQGFRDTYLKWPSGPKPGPIGKAYMVAMTIGLIVFFVWLAAMPVVNLVSNLR